MQSPEWYFVEKMEENGLRAIFVKMNGDFIKDRRGNDLPSVDGVGVSTKAGAIQVGNQFMAVIAIA